MTIDSVIFDLDGTLWDACQAVADSWRYSLSQRYACSASPDTDAVRSIMGMTSADIANKLFSSFEDRALEVCISCINDEPDFIAERGAEAYKGVGEMLKSLSQDRKLFIVSNCLDGYIQCFLKCTGFSSYIYDFVSEGASGKGKAENISDIKLKHSLKNAVYVGDTASDEKSARESGCIFVHAAYGFGMANAPDAIIYSPADLVAVLMQLEEGYHG